jgi:hypothetical protein
MTNANRKENYLLIEAKPQPNISTENTSKASFFEGTSSVEMYKLHVRKTRDGMNQSSEANHEHQFLKKDSMRGLNRMEL